MLCRVRERHTPPVFVVTHHARPPLALEGGTTFTFVTAGIEEALAQARRPALEAARDCPPVACAGVVNG
jgi:hypothetical protein